jgi:excisionase family DNA binding protein
MKNEIPLADRGSLSVDEFATWSGLGRTTVVALVRTGELRSRKVGRRTIIAMPEAKRFLAGGSRSLSRA